MAEINEDLYGKPVAAVTRVPVKEFDTRKSSAALVSGAETLAKLGLQADEAFATTQLRKDLTTTVSAYEQVQSYVQGDASNLFTGNSDVDEAINGMIGEIDDIKEAVRQGVMVPELGKARLETVLKNAKARRPNYADQLNAVASDALGFRVSGYATNKLFMAEKEKKAELSPQEKLRNKLHETSVMHLYTLGMGPEALALPVDVAIRTSSKMKEMEGKKEAALIDFRILDAQATQVDKLTKRTASVWADQSLNQQIAIFSSMLQSAPTDPTARAEWDKQNVPRAIATLQDMRTTLESNFMTDIRAMYGDEAVAMMDKTVVQESIAPSLARIDQMIKDFRDPVQLESLKNGLELELTGMRDQFYAKSPVARKRASLFATPEGRDADALNQSVAGVITGQQLSERVDNEYRQYFGMTTSPEPTEDEKKTAYATNMAFDTIAAVETPEQAQEAFNNYVQLGDSDWFEGDLSNPTERIAAADAFAVRALGNIDAVEKGFIPAENATAAIQAAKSAVQGMLTLPEHSQYSNIGTSSMLLDSLNSPQLRAAEEKYGVSFEQERELARRHVREDVGGLVPLYNRTLQDNYKQIPIAGGEPVEVRPLSATRFVFDTKGRRISASVNQNEVRQRLDSAGIPRISSRYGEAQDAYSAGARTFNNSKSKYREGVSALFFEQYDVLKNQYGKVDPKNQEQSLALASSGIMQQLGYVDANLESDIYAALQSPGQLSENPSLAETLVYRYAQTGGSILNVLPEGSIRSNRDRARGLTQVYSAGLMRHYANDGKLVFN